MSVALAARVGDPVGAHVGIGSGARILGNALMYATIGALAAGLVVAAVAAAPMLLAGVATGVVIGAAGGALASFAGVTAMLGVGLSAAARGIKAQREEESKAPKTGGGCSNVDADRPT
ncbi:MAG: hypothetical protein U0235_33000 [Polyangiaceae bacterium]